MIMNADGLSPTGTCTNIAHASFSESSPIVTTYNYLRFSYGQNIATRSTAGDPSNPWLRTVNQTVAAVGIALSTSLLIMRLYTKARLMKKFWWDDVFIILAWIFSVVCQAVILYGYANSGYGVHIWDLNPSELRTYPKTIFAASVIYIPCLACAKISILMFYYTLVSLIDLYRYVIYVAGAFIAAYSTALFFASVFACNPVLKSWDGPLVTTQGRCINHQALWLTVAITNTFSDIVLILIPVPMILRLRVSVSKKVYIAFFFAIGCLTTITSIVRLATIWPLITSNDSTYEMALASLLIFIEANFIIICGCLPYLRQFLRQHAPRLYGHGSNVDSSGSRDHSKKGGCRLMRLDTTTTACESVLERPSLTQEGTPYEV